MSPLFILRVSVALTAIVSPSRDHDSLPNRTLTLCPTSNECGACDALNASAGTCEHDEIIGAKKGEASVFFQSAIVVIVLFIALFLVYLHSDSGRSIHSIDDTSKKRESLFLKIFFVVIAIARVEGARIPPVFCRSIRICPDCSPPFNCFTDSWCLFISRESSNWFDAAKECSKHGGTLISIRSKRDVYNLEDYLRKSSECGWSTRTEIFLGLIRTPAAAEDTFNYQWSDGSPFISDAYSRWAGHFNVLVCATVVVHRRSSSDAAIVWGGAIPCSDLRSYICEKKPSRPGVSTAQAWGYVSVRLMGVTPNRGQLEMFTEGEWTPFFMPRHKMAYVCKNMGYIDALDIIQSDSSGFLSCRASVVDSIALRISDRRIEMRFSGKYWGEVCAYESFDIPFFPADDMCRSFGYAGGKINFLFSTSYSGYFKYFMGCARGAKFIENCTYTEVKGRSCNHFEIVCQNFTFVQDVRVRLVDGLRESDGVVEIHYDRSWGVVCADKWDLNDANVVCRQLGYAKAASVTARRGPVFSPYLNFYAHCKGTEASFIDCEKLIGLCSKSAEVTCKENEYCPRGWQLYTDYCYTISTESYAFDDFGWDKGCSSKSLVSISSPHEQAFVLSLLAASDAEVWIGLRGIKEFDWVNGDRMTYALWASGEPNFSHSLRNCVAIDSRTGYWKTVDCEGRKLKRLCKKPLVDFRKELRRSEAPSSHQCRKDELYFSDACYYLSKNDDMLDSLTLADQKCKSREARLASITSIHENAFVAKETSAMTGPIYWIGLVFENTSDAFTWRDGSPVSITRWAKYEPKYENGECVIFGFDGLDFTWSVSNCSAKAGYICKRMVKGSNATTSVTPSFDYVYMCPGDWTKIGNRCFKRIDTLKTWRKSLTDCQKFSQVYGSLASVRSAQEQSVFFDLLGADDAWIGLNDIDSKGSYVWADGSSFSYSKLRSAENTTFSIKMSHRCVAARNDSWKARNCADQMQSVCVTPAVLDYDECYNKSYSCQENMACKNLLSSYECECREGWTKEELTGSGGLASDVSLCADIDECEIPGQCHWGADCINTAGSFECTCLSGFIGDGRNCSDVNECSRKETNDCHDYATCNNTIGSYLCKCNDGYTGNGRHCQDFQISQSTIILSVAGSFIFFFFLTVVAVAVYVRCNSGKLRFVAPLSWFDSNLFKRRNEWEINHGDVMLLEKIGEGLFGVVLKAQLLHRPALQSRHRIGNKSGNENAVFVACKMLKGKHQLEDDFLQEIDLMKGIGRHPHIVSMLACITRRQPLCLIAEYCCYGDLLNYLIRRGRLAFDRSHSIVNSGDDSKPPSYSEQLEQIEHDENAKERRTDVIEDADKDECNDEAERNVESASLKFTTSDLLSFAWQISSGMDYLSGKGLVHRDLACRNVLIAENNLLKVSDFGLTRAVYDDGQYSQKTARRLPLRWMSIEAITHRLFTEKSDVWSFGVVVWEICTLGAFPYPCIVNKDLQAHLLEGNRLNRPGNCSEELYTLMFECWRANPEVRPAFSVLLKKLGKLLEAENPNKYIDLDTASLYPFRGKETRESDSGGSGVDSVLGTTPAGERTGIRHLGGGSLIERETTV